MSVDVNNRSGGPNLILTAKAANVIQFFDAATLQKTGEISMPASTHEMVLSPDGRRVFATVYGGGIFGKNVHPDRRVAVIDLASKSIMRLIDVGADLAPHSVMTDVDGMLWCTAELASQALAIDPKGGGIVRIATERPAHWLAISHAADKVFAACKTSDFVAVIDRKARRMVDRLPVPTLSESLCVSSDGGTIYVCSHQTPELYVFDTRTHALTNRLVIAGGEAARTSSSGSVSRRTDNIFASPRCSTIMRPCSKRRPSRRWPRSPRPRGRWASGLRQTAGMPIYAAMTTLWCWNLSCRPGV